MAGPSTTSASACPDAKSLVAMQERLERAGHPHAAARRGSSAATPGRPSSGPTTPTGRLWEVYTFEGDIDHRGAGQSKDVIPGSSLSTAAPVAWEHRMTDRCPIASRLPTDRPTRSSAARDVQPAARGRKAAVARGRCGPRLAVGRRVFVHVLVGEGEVEDPDLPGRASKVRSVPLEADPVALLEAAGLVGVRMLKFDSKPCFVRNGVGMRSFNSKASNLRSRRARSLEVIYKGPFREVRDDGGRVFARGRRVRGTRQHRSAVPNGRMGQPVHHLRISLDAAPYPSPPAVAREAISLLTPASPAA